MNDGGIRPSECVLRSVQFRRPSRDGNHLRPEAGTHLGAEHPPAARNRLSGTCARVRQLTKASRIQ